MTVLGCSTAAPHADGPAAAFLVEWAGTTLLLDVGQGSIRRLQRLMDPRDLSAAIVGHMHADHYLDLVGLRYLYPWGDAAPRTLPVHVPVGGRARLDALAAAISERTGFFESAYDVVEYDGARPLAVGPLTVRFIPGRHYVPAWGVVVEAPDGSRLAYTGDTGPSDAVVEAIAGADLLLIEAALRRPADDDRERGHLTAEEAIEMARPCPRRVGPPRALRAGAAGRAGGDLPGGRAVDPAGLAGLTVTVGRRTAGVGPIRYEARPSPSAAAARDM